MLITEFRITMPMTVEEYQVGMLYSVAAVSLEETGGGEGVEVLNNEPYSDVPLLNGRFASGQFTRKKYHLETKVPAFIKYIAPTGSLTLLEEAWNASLYCKTVITNPGYMKENFVIKLETFCAPDRGESENVHELNAEQLAQRQVVHIDIASDPVDSADAALADPGRTQAVKPDPPRGPLGGEWRKHVSPVMTVYKLVTMEFKWFGLQSTVEAKLMAYQQQVFTRFHRKIFCWTDKWFGMTMADIRALEDKAKNELQEQIGVGEVANAGM